MDYGRDERGPQLEAIPGALCMFILTQRVVIWHVLGCGV